MDHLSASVWRCVARLTRIFRYLILSYFCGYYASENLFFLNLSLHGDIPVSRSEVSRETVWAQRPAISSSRFGCRLSGQTRYHHKGLTSTTCSYTYLLSKAAMPQLQTLPLICTRNEARLYTWSCKSNKERQHGKQESSCCWCDNSKRVMDQDS